MVVRFSSLQAREPDSGQGSKEIEHFKQFYLQTQLICKLCIDKVGDKVKEYEKTEFTQMWKRDARKLETAQKHFPKCSSQN